MPMAIDLTGQQFGWLKVIARAGSSPSRQALWNCECRCGRERIVRADKLTECKIRNCGECKKETQGPPLSRTTIDRRSRDAVEFVRS